MPETLFFEEKGNFFEEYEPDEFPADDICSDACESDDDVIEIGEGEEISNTERENKPVLLALLAFVSLIVKEPLSLREAWKRTRLN